MSFFRQQLHWVSRHIGTWLGYNPGNIHPGGWFYQVLILIQLTLKVLPYIDRDVDNILSKNTKRPLVEFYCLTLTTLPWFPIKSSFETSATLLKAQLIPVSNAECSLAMGRRHIKRSGNHLFAKIFARLKTFQNQRENRKQCLQTATVDGRSDHREHDLCRQWGVRVGHLSGRTEKNANKKNIDGVREYLNI